MKNKFLIFASLILCIASVFSFALIPKSSASAEEITYYTLEPDIKYMVKSNFDNYFVYDTKFNIFQVTISLDVYNSLLDEKPSIYFDSAWGQPAANSDYSIIKFYPDNHKFNMYFENFSNFEYSDISNVSEFSYYLDTSTIEIFGSPITTYYICYCFPFDFCFTTDLEESLVCTSSSNVTLSSYFMGLRLRLNTNIDTLNSNAGTFFLTYSLNDVVENSASLIVAPQFYNVTFNSYDNICLSSSSVISGEYVSIPDAPVREGYDFIGWTSSVDGLSITSPITQDVTFTATYKLKTYDVVIKDWDGSVLQTTSVNHGDTYTTDYIPSRTGYTFTGYTSDTGYVLGEVVTSDIVLTATYTINQYNVLFLGNGNTIIKSITCDYGTYLNVPTPPAIVGYTFSHWESSVDGVSPTSAVTQDVTFTAKYTFNVYVVNFIDENGVVQKSLNINHGDIVSTDDIPTTDKPGYKFFGWKSSVDTLSVNSQILSDVTFTKQYEIIQEFWDGVEYAGNTNYDNGYNDGQASVDTDTIYDNGYDKGYSDGYEVGLGQDNTYLLSDLFFGILDAPFNVISNAFDFEIFGIDIGNFFIVLISFLLIGWVIKRFL